MEDPQAHLGPQTRLSGRWIWAARILWVVITLATISMFVIAQSVPKAQNIPIELYQQLPTATRSLYDSISFISDWIFTATYLVIGLVVFWRKSDDWMALLVSLTLITFGMATFIDGVKAAADVVPALALPAASVAALGQVLIAFFFYLFPDGRFVPKIMIIPLVLWIISEVPPYLFSNSLLNIDNLPSPYPSIIWPSFILSFLGAQLYRYFRSSNPFQRRQTKWVVFGTSIGLTGFMVCIFLTQGIPLTFRTWVGYALFNDGIRLFMMLIPISIGMAILRSHLWDIDVVIRRTLLYGTLIALLGAVYMGSVLLLQQLFQKIIFGPYANAQIANTSRSGIEVVLSTLLVVALFNPLRQRVQQGVDRRFYRQKFDAERTLEEFNAAITSEVDIEETKRYILKVINQTLHPEIISIWLKK
jgi:hypothetical protein